jgi:uncharacterized protein YjbJ (UPF0337 family)
MNQEKFKGNWHDLKGAVQQKWDKLTSEDIARINGDWPELAGTIQHAYGVTRDEAERQLKEWAARQAA